MKKTFKWIGIGLGGLVGVLALALGGLYFIGTAKVNKQYDVPVETISIPTDAQSIQRGEHLATIYICIRCHTGNLGGELSFEVPGMVSIRTPNLTSGAGGVGSSFTDADWVRAIRHGVGTDGFHPGLLHRIKHRTRGLAHRAVAAVHRVGVVREAQRKAVSEAAGNGDVTDRGVLVHLRQAGLVAGERRLLIAETHVEFGIERHHARRRRAGWRGAGCAWSRRGTERPP